MKIMTGIAIYHGGVLNVRRNKWNVEAAMIWPLIPEAEPISVEAKTLDEAMDALEAALVEDAANEMIESGAV